jgi:hypothetical protein
MKMNDPAAADAVSNLFRHAGLDKPAPYSIRGHPVLLFWIPAFTRMTKPRQAAGNAPKGIQAAKKTQKRPTAEKLPGINSKRKTKLSSREIQIYLASRNP